METWRMWTGLGRRTFAAMALAASAAWVFGAAGCSDDSREFAGDPNSGGSAGSGGMSGAGGRGGSGGSLGSGGSTGSAGTLGSGGALGSGGTAGQTGDAAGGTGGSTGGTSGDAGACVENAACQPGNGLCKSGTCSPCQDRVDDANCAAAYGAGKLCAGGACVVGCHDSSACAGKVCDTTSFTCRSCTQDADCSTAAPYCNTSTGSCVATPPPCTNGTVCNGTGWCCGTTCYPGAATGGCCAATDCTNGTCNATTHVCKPNTCSDPAPTDRFYVDPGAGATMSGVGSTQCPFRSISTALSQLPATRSSTFTICTRGTFDGTNQPAWPINVPNRVTLDGKYCGAASTPNSVLKVPSGNSGITFRQAGPSAISGFDITYQGTVPERTGVYVSNTGSSTVSVSFVTISGFHWGIYSGKATEDPSSGNVSIQQEVAALSGDYGLVVGSSGKATIDETSSPTVRARFERHTGAGIWVDDGTLTVRGRQYSGSGSTALSRTVSAQQNAIGLRATSRLSTLTLDYFDASSNTGPGMEFHVGVIAKVTHSVLTNNRGTGLTVTAPTSGGSPDVSSINFGTTATGTGAGQNAIYGNRGAGVCLFFGATGLMPAAGNAFSSDASKQCSGSPTAKLTHDPDCSRAIDTAYAVQGGGPKMLIDKCQFD